MGDNEGSRCVCVLSPRCVFLYFLYTLLTIIYRYSTHRTVVTRTITPTMTSLSLPFSLNHHWRTQQQIHQRCPGAPKMAQDASQMHLEPVAMSTKGPNDVRHVIWAISTCFSFFFFHVYIILTHVFRHYLHCKSTRRVGEGSRNENGSKRHVLNMSFGP